MLDQVQTEEVTEAEAIGLITEQVYDLIGNPISKWAVAATIESQVVRDIDARTDYGYDSVFDLADVVYKRIKKKVYDDLDKDEDDHDEFNFGGYRRTLKLFAKFYSAGMVFSLPMISQIVAIIIFEYALWAWFDFNEAQATVVALGTIIAFILTGGFIQTLGRLVSKYKGEENYYLAAKASWSENSYPFYTTFRWSHFLLKPDTSVLSTAAYHSINDVYGAYIAAFVVCSGIVCFRTTNNDFVKHSIRYRCCDFWDGLC